MWFRADINDAIAIKSAGFNFMPSWWHRHFGFEYGERIVFDPDYRVALHQDMRRAMAERFGAASLGETDPRPVVVAPDWENAVIGALCGCEVEYPRDNYPLMRHLPEERIGSLSVPADLWSVFPYNEIARQVRALNARLSADVVPQLPARGVLNEAVLLRGDAILTDMFLEPERAGRVLGFSVSLFEAQVRANVAAGCGSVMLFNCTVPMVGPGTYAERLLGYDAGIAALCRSLGAGFSLHHCGTLDPYTTAYRSLSPRFDWIEIGHTSALRPALDAFPEAEVSLIVSTHLMRNGTAAEVGATIDRILDESRGSWHRLSLNVADIDCGTPDENIFAVYEHLKAGA
jgi:hypothetical protein